jgi:hypothetical protein
MRLKRRNNPLTLPFFNVTKLEYFSGKAHLSGTRWWAFVWRKFMFDAQKILQQVLGGQLGEGRQQKSGGLITSLVLRLAAWPGCCSVPNLRGKSQAPWLN